MRAWQVSIVLGVVFSGAAASAQCGPGRVPVVVPSGQTICLPANAAALDNNPKFATQLPTATASATATATAPADTATPTPADTATATPIDTATETPTVTPTPCGSGGAAVGGVCWHLGAVGESCVTTCAGLGEFCDAATITFAGSGGTNANCLSVLAALGAQTDPFVESSECPNAIGCAEVPGFAGGRCAAPPTTCEATDPSAARACACQ